MATVKDWSNAYALQAKADFMTYQALERLRSEAVIGWSIPICHKLQFLQMACEKLAKAHLCTRGTAPASLQASHAYISKVLPVVIRQEMVAVNFRGKSGRARSFAGHIAKKLRRLHSLSGGEANGQITANTRGRMRTNASTSLSRGRSLQLN